MKIITGDVLIRTQKTKYLLTSTTKQIVILSNFYEGGMMGAVMGVGMGLFMGAMGDVSPIQIIQGWNTTKFQQLRFNRSYGDDQDGKFRKLLCENSCEPA